MDAVLQALLTETVIHERYLDVQDSYGTPQYGPPVTLPARVEPSPQRIATQQGEERLSRARVFLDGTVKIDLRDRLTLPDSTRPAILVAMLLNDDLGVPDHWEIRL